jgi:hypothetical protein
VTPVTWLLEVAGTDRTCHVQELHYRRELDRVGVCDFVLEEGPVPAVGDQVQVRASGIPPDGGSSWVFQGWLVEPPRVERTGTAKLVHVQAVDDLHLLEQDLGSALVRFANSTHWPRAWWPLTELVADTDGELTAPNADGRLDVPDMLVRTVNPSGDLPALISSSGKGPPGDGGAALMFAPRPDNAPDSWAYVTTPSSMQPIPLDPSRGWMVRFWLTVERLPKNVERVVLAVRMGDGSRYEVHFQANNAQGAVRYVNPGGGITRLADQIVAGRTQQLVLQQYPGDSRLRVYRDQYIHGMGDLPVTSDTIAAVEIGGRDHPYYGSVAQVSVVLDILQHDYARPVRETAYAGLLTTRPAGQQFYELGLHAGVPVSSWWDTQGPRTRPIAEGRSLWEQLRRVLAGWGDRKVYFKNRQLAVGAQDWQMYPTLAVDTVRRPNVWIDTCQLLPPSSQHVAERFDAVDVILINGRAVRSQVDRAIRPRRVDQRDTTLISGAAASRLGIDMLTAPGHFIAPLLADVHIDSRDADTPGLLLRTLDLDSVLAYTDHDSWAAGQVTSLDLRARHDHYTLDVQLTPCVIDPTVGPTPTGSWVDVANTHPTWQQLANTHPTWQQLANTPHPHGSP